jgi:superfamily I DNA/RNA helicase
MYAGSVGLDPSFTIHDREDSGDLVNLVRHEQGFSEKSKRFPLKGTCLAIDHVLVDEYQDTNALQASIMHGLKPDGAGLTVVGDDAQAIYGFRAATVRNILDFPKQFDPPAKLITLEQNYRSTQPILVASNAVIGLARERFTKDLRSHKVKLTACASGTSRIWNSATPML